MGAPYSDPRSPRQNGIVENFGDWLQDTPLASEIFATLAESRPRADRWRLYYNHPSDQAGAGQTDPGELRGGVPGAASAPARSPRLHSGKFRHVGGGYEAATLVRGGPMKAPCFM